MTATDGNKESTPKTCGCLPYKDGLLITPQALSIVTFGTFWFIFRDVVIIYLLPAIYITSLTVVIMLQVVWCCRMSRAGLIAAAILSYFSALGCVALGVLVSNPDWLHTFNRQIYFEDYFYISSFVIAASWLAIAICLTVFTCRYKAKYSTREAIHERNDNNV